MPETVAALRNHMGWILGPTFAGEYPDDDPIKGHPSGYLRRNFALFANARPVQARPQLKPLIPDLDIAILREAQGRGGATRGAPCASRPSAEPGGSNLTLDTAAIQPNTSGKQAAIIHVFPAQEAVRKLPGRPIRRPRESGDPEASD